MKEGKTIKVKPGFHVGWFMGSDSIGRKKRFVGLGAAKEDPTSGEWLSITEARKLRDALDRILDSIRG